MRQSQVSFWRVLAHGIIVYWDRTTTALRWKRRRAFWLRAEIRESDNEFLSSVDNIPDFEST